ncbi:hypothetical protein F444_11775 [Phytophthora nicotianae P1976]|uniref:Uncharacterized protein n=1 Tax=Phytophthora nicotianae P1976 TaxID=1317066 RepID=A0A080ZZD6_PHYNI|nr:hypothetical protein F444_11775 [Phytophthora nicotianae P1976]
MMDNATVRVKFRFTVAQLKQPLGWGCLAMEYEPKLEIMFRESKR